MLCKKCVGGIKQREVLVVLLVSMMCNSTSYYYYLNKNIIMFD